MLGVSRQHVSTLVNAKAVNFPAPEVELTGGRVWSREAIEQWMSQNPARVGGRRPVCAFCGKGEQHVPKLVQGPPLIDDGQQIGWTAICNDCVDLAATAIIEEAHDVAAALPRLSTLLK